MEAKSATVVGVEESQEAVQLVLTDAEASLVSQEVLDFEWAYCEAGVAIKSLEGGVWGEITDSAESLASLFEALLAITDRDEEVLESVFRFVSKHVSIQKVRS